MDGGEQGGRQGRVSHGVDKLACAPSQRGDSCANALCAYTQRVDSHAQECRLSLKKVGAPS